MRLKEQNPAKKPRHAERPFPWRCRRCGEVKVVPTRTDYPLEVRYDGRLVPFVARGIDIPTCQDCGERVFTAEVDHRINRELYAHLQLLTPEEIRECIEKLGISQKEMARRLGIAEATLSRWLNDMVIQSRAMDNYLRVFFRFPEVRAVLGNESPVTTDPPLLTEDSPYASVERPRRATIRPKRHQP